MGWIVGIVIIMSFLIGLFIYFIIKRMFMYREQRNINRDIYALLIQWLTMMMDKTSIEQKLVDMGAHNIVIYGMGMLGDQLLYELQGSEKINVVYVVDENPANANLRVSTRRNFDELDNIDTIVVSDIFAEINTAKWSKMDQKILSLSSLVYD